MAQVWIVMGVSENWMNAVRIINEIEEKLTTCRSNNYIGENLNSAKSTNNEFDEYSDELKTKPSIRQARFVQEDGERIYCERS